LIVPDDECCRLTVGDEVLRWREGRAMVFDDSFLHSANNDHTSEAR
jgi:aspartyl/asparaginyl beta-hydroxylase (cupin superfamily)